MQSVGKTKTTITKKKTVEWKKTAGEFRTIHPNHCVSLASSTTENNMAAHLADVFAPLFHGSIQFSLSPMSPESMLRTFFLLLMVSQFCQTCHLNSAIQELIVMRVSRCWGYWSCEVMTGKSSLSLSLHQTPLLFWNTNQTACF